MSQNKLNKIFIIGIISAALMLPVLLMAAASGNLGALVADSSDYDDSGTTGDPGDGGSGGPTFCP